MIKEEEYLKAKQMVQEYEKQLNIYGVMFCSNKKYYIDFGLGCYFIGKYDCFDGEYFWFIIGDNHKVGVFEKNIFKSKQKFMKELCGENKT